MRHEWIMFTLTPKKNWLMFCQKQMIYDWSRKENQNGISVAVGIKEQFLKRERFLLGNQNGLRRSCQFHKHQSISAGAHKNSEQTLQLKKTIDGCDSSQVYGY